MTLKRTGKPEYAALEQNVDDAFRKQNADNVLNGAILLENLKLVAGQDNTVAHKLGRTPKGYHVARLSDDARIYDSPTRNTIPDKVMLLRVSANVTASLLVF